MSNASTADTLRSFRNYLGAAFTDATAPWDIFQSQFKYELQSDGMSWSANAALTTTVTAVKTSAAKLYAVVVCSGTAIPGNSAGTAASNTAFVQVFNVATGSVTLATTAPDHVVKCPANECVVHMVHSAGSANLYGTAISIAATTTSKGNTALSAADLPSVFLVYA